MMPKGPEEIELDQVWIGAEDLPVHFANAFAGIPGPNAIFLNVILEPNLGHSGTILSREFG
jgi:hypothetical protein